MAFKRDEVHVKQFSWKLRIIVSIVFLIAVLLLVYLIAYSFANLDPFITLVLIVVLMIVVGVGLFSIDVSFYREIQ
ncbi:MAG: hypothetical protein KAT94_03825 [Candidatus Aenigmarchaeota archaeon]|nr:hypothetical protein [Candidatus Aenigmarchaeota archaeon]MCK4531972.1 hypothetical protein [Candidatus Aenigmarchaeota archaeon]